MADRTRAYNWSGTALGDPAGWPDVLLTTVNILLASKSPMFLWWGDDLIQFYNDAYRPSMGDNGKHPAALGQRGADCWQEIWLVIYPLIKNVMEQCEATWSEDQLIPIIRNGRMEEVYWTFGYSPVCDRQGKARGVLVNCIETTASVKNLARLNQANTALQASEQNLRNLVEQAPVAISYLSGNKLVIETANELILKVWGKSPNIIGKPLAIALPELQGQPFLQILEDVFASGRPFAGKSYPATIDYNGILEERYYDFVYQPMKNAEGICEGILVVANDVSDNVQARHRVEESENRLRQVIAKCPYIMLVLKGPDMVVEMANQALYDYWNKTEAEALGKPLLDVLPELKGQPFPGLLNQVYDTGIAFGQDEVSNYFDTPDGRLVKYISYRYEPLTDDQGNITRILVAAEDVTRLVEDRNKIKTAEETLRLSLQAARLGTFDLDLVRGRLYWDARCRELFGIDHYGPVDYDKDFLANLHEEDRERIETVISEVFDKALTGGEYDVEYRTVGASDKRVRWVRAKGKAFFNEEDKAIRFIGSVLDITDKKMEEMRRNDFFSMASHELKTPLTSIKGFAQLLQAKAKQENNAFQSDLLNRLNQSADKMTTLIHGFLNNARLQAGKLDIKLLPVEIDPLLEEVVADAQMLTASHRMNIIPSNYPVEVIADREKISQVIENLISNAIKYSPAGTEITIGCRVLKDSAEIFVRDQGIGIAEKDQPHLFERFYRVQHQQGHTVPGFGIGLYLVAEILKYHHSQIKIDSEPGKGSRFYFSLPLSS